MQGFFSLKISPSCQTLSKALDMSKKRLLTSNPLSKVVKISWVIDNSWFMQESPGWKPEWFLEVFKEFISREIDKHFIKNKSFKYFTTNWK